VPRVATCMMKIGICSVSRKESESVTKSRTLRSVKKGQQRQEKIVQSISMQIIMIIGSQVPRKGRVSDGVVVMVRMMGGRRRVTATVVKNAMTGPLPLSLASVIESGRAKVENEKGKVEKEIEEGKQQAGKVGTGEGKRQAENEKEKVEKGTEEGKRQAKNEIEKRKRK